MPMYMIVEKDLVLEPTRLHSSTNESIASHNSLRTADSAQTRLSDFSQPRKDSKKFTQKLTQPDFCDCHRFLIEFLSKILFKAILILTVVTHESFASALIVRRLDMGQLAHVQIVDQISINYHQM